MVHSLRHIGEKRVINADAHDATGRVTLEAWDDQATVLDSFFGNQPTLHVMVFAVSWNSIKRTINFRNHSDIIKVDDAGVIASLANNTTPPIPLNHGLPVLRY